MTTPIAKRRVVHFNPSCDDWHPARNVVPFDSAICGAAPMFERVGVEEVRGIERPEYGNELSGFTQTKNRAEVTCPDCIAKFPEFAKKQAENPNYYPWLK